MGLPGRTRETAPMAGLLVRGGSVLVDGAFEEAELAAEDGVLVDVAAVGSDAHVIDAEGLLVVPGYVDLQCNGGLGIDLAGDPERLWELGAALPRFGVTAWLPTIVTTPDGIVDRAIDALAAGPPQGWRGAAPLGLHLEGPFLSEEKRGAHPAALLRPPSLAAIEGWSRERGVAVVTLAPDVPGALEVVEALVARGVVVSLGHTPATHAQAVAAVDAGATWVTHLFNAMAPLHHREPGLAGVALADDRLHVGLIPDGIHLHPQVVAMAQRALGHRLTIVTDAVAALGMPPGRQALGRTEVTIDDARRPPRRRHAGGEQPRHGPGRAEPRRLQRLRSAGGDPRRVHRPRGRPRRHGPRHARARDPGRPVAADRRPASSSRR